MQIDRSRFLLFVSAIAAPVATVSPDTTSAEPMPLADTRCSNSQGEVPQCSLQAPGPQCESFKDTKKECPVVRSLLKPRVAQRFMECLNGKSGTKDICEFTSASTCMPFALAAACIEPGTEATCRRSVAQCDRKGKGHELTMQGCQALLSGTVASQHRRLISSMVEFCTTRYGYWDLAMVAHGH